MKLRQPPARGSELLLPLFLGLEDRYLGQFLLPPAGNKGQQKRAPKRRRRRRIAKQQTSFKNQDNRPRRSRRSKRTRGLGVHLDADGYMDTPIVAVAPVQTASKRDEWQRTSWCDPSLCRYYSAWFPLLVIIQVCSLPRIILARTPSTNSSVAQVMP